MNCEVNFLFGDRMKKFFIKYRKKGYLLGQKKFIFIQFNNLFMKYQIIFEWV